MTAARAARRCSVCHRAGHDARAHRPNPDGAMFRDANGELHPIRSWAGYDAGRLAGSAGPKRAPRAAPRPPRQTRSRRTIRAGLGQHAVLPPGETGLPLPRSGYTYDVVPAVGYKEFWIRREADQQWHIHNRAYPTLKDAKAYADRYREEHGYPRRNPARRARRSRP